MVNQYSQNYKNMNKILTRLFWGGFDLRLGLALFVPIPIVSLYITPLLFIFGYKLVVLDEYLVKGLFYQICLGIFFFIMYVIFIHFRYWPVKFKDMTDYQKWLYGKGLKFNNSGLKQTMTEAEWLEWEDIEKHKLVV